MGLAAVFAIVLAVAATSFAAGERGLLRFTGCISAETQGAKCAQLPSAVRSGRDTGLYRLRQVAVSPDGASVYAVSQFDDAVSHFARDSSTGALTYVGCISGELQSSPACALLPSASAFGESSGLDSPRGIALSPDGRYVYAASFEDAAVARFERDSSTGALSYVDCISGATETASSCAQISGAKPDGRGSGLYRLSSLAVTTDGRSLYATSSGDAAIARFDRDPTTGALTYAGCISGATSVGTSCAHAPGATSTGDGSGLEFLGAVVATSDGHSVLAAATTDAAIVRFRRDPTTGALTYLGCISGATETTGRCELIAGAGEGGRDSALGGVRALALSPDGDSIYAAGRAISRVALDLSSGELRLTECISGASRSARPCRTVPSATSDGRNSGLDAPSSVAVSDDGRSLYATAEGDHSVVRFRRKATNGAITYAGCISATQETAGTCKVIRTATAGGGNTGLYQPLSLAISADGRSVYVASYADAAITRFRRFDAPQTTIVSGPRGATVKRTATLRFRSSMPGSTFRCRLDGRRPTKCRSPRRYRNLAPGKHVFRVVATNRAGDSDPTPARRSWWVKKRRH